MATPVTRPTTSAPTGASGVSAPAGSSPAVSSSAVSQPAGSQPAGSPSAGSSAPPMPAACDLSTQCGHCGGPMVPEHAHYRCTVCFQRDSCCDGPY